MKTIRELFQEFYEKYPNVNPLVISEIVSESYNAGMDKATKNALEVIDKHYNKTTKKPL